MHESDDELPLGWRKLRVISGMLASIMIPIVIILIANVVNTTIKGNELSLSYVEMAADILSEKPAPGTENLRKWAIDVINNYSDVQLSQKTQDELEAKELPVRSTQKVIQKSPIDVSVNLVFDGNGEVTTVIPVPGQQDINASINTFRRLNCDIPMIYFRPDYLDAKDFKK